MENKERRGGWNKGQRDKKQITQDYLNGKPVKELAKEHGVDPTTIRKDTHEQGVAKRTRRR